jgi:peptidoglycan hydrolase CwlO-like protein
MMKTLRHAVGAIGLMVLLTGTSGCDWWPPTLQERIGQQEAQIKALLNEKARMQAQVTELTKVVEEIKTQDAQLQETNNALKTQVEQLKVALMEAETKSARPKNPAPATKRKK